MYDQLRSAGAECAQIRDTEAKNASEFEQAQSNLSLEIERLGDSVARFIDRMSPMLRKQTPEPPSTGPTSAPTPQKSPASENIDSMAREIRRIRNMADEALGRSAL